MWSSFIHNDQSLISIYSNWPITDHYYIFITITDHLLYTMTNHKSQFIHNNKWLITIYTRWSIMNHYLFKMTNHWSLFKHNKSILDRHLFILTNHWSALFPTTNRCSPFFPSTHVLSRKSLYIMFLCANDHYDSMNMQISWLCHQATYSDFLSMH